VGFMISTGVGDISVYPSAVPEPTTILLVGCGLASLAVAGRKRRSATKALT